MAIDDCDFLCGIDAAVRSDVAFRRQVLLGLKELIEAAEAISGTADISSVTEAQVEIDANNDTVLAANANRLSGYILNTSADTVYLSFSATAVLNDSVPLAPGQYLPLSVDGRLYKGVVSGIKSGDTVDVLVVEAV